MPSSFLEHYGIPFLFTSQRVNRRNLNEQVFFIATKRKKIEWEEGKTNFTFQNLLQLGLRL